MKSLSVSAAVAALAIGVCSCGGGTAARPVSHRSGGTAAVPASAASANVAPAPVEVRVDGDRDNDAGAPHDERDNRELDFGREATPSEKRAIAALIQRYYAAAVAGDGAGACALLYSTLAEAVPEDFGGISASGPPYMRGTACSVCVTGLFRHFHPQLAAEVPGLRVLRVRLEEHHGLALLGFGKLPERTISVGREGSAWRMTQLIDNEVP